MNTYVLLYDDFVEFEITLTLLLLRDKSQIQTFTVDEDIVPSFGTMKVKSDMNVLDVDPEIVDFLLIPGGEPGKYSERTDIQTLLRAIHERGIPIAAICGGPEFLAQAGILDGKQMTHGHDPEYAKQVFSECHIQDIDVVVDGNIITARGQAYAEFAVEVYRQLGYFENEDEAVETLRYFKNVH